MRRKNPGMLFVILSAVCFSLAGVLIKFIPWSSMTINGVRSIFASVVLLLYMKATHHKLVFNRAVLFGAVCNVLMNLTFVMATKLTTAANAIVLQFTMPIFLILFSYLFFRKTPTGAEIVTCVTVFAGIVCFFVDSLTAGGMLGNFLAMLSGAAYAVVFLLKKIPHADFESSAVVAQWISIVISVPFWFSETSFAWPNLAAVAVLGTVQLGLGYVFLSLGLNRVSPVAASLTSTIEPILNPLLVAVFYPEPMGMFSTVGAVIVLLSVGIYNIFNAKRGEACGQRRKACE